MNQHYWPHTIRVGHLPGLPPYPVANCWGEPALQPGFPCPFTGALPSPFQTVLILLFLKDKGGSVLTTYVSLPAAW